MILICWGFFQILLNNSGYKHIQYKVISTITLPSVYTWMHCILLTLEVLTVQNINWLYTQSSIYSYLNADFLNLWQISHYKHYYNISTWVSKIVSPLILVSILVKRYFPFKHGCRQNAIVMGKSALYLYLWYFHVFIFLCSFCVWSLIVVCVIENYVKKCVY